jgi:hypothetical protein
MLEIIMYLHMLPWHQAFLNFFLNFFFPHINPIHDSWVPQFDDGKNDVHCC